MIDDQTPAILGKPFLALRATIMDFGIPLR
jgi:hypothetical protein